MPMSRITGNSSFLFATSSVTSASFSPDGRLIVSGSKDKTIRVWDSNNGQPLLTLNGHTDEIYFVSFSRDGYQILSGSEV